jgi:hypothetical protein
MRYGRKPKTIESAKRQTKTTPPSLHECTHEKLIGKMKMKNRLKSTLQFMNIQQRQQIVGGFISTF